MKCSWKALSASWIHLLGTPAYTVYVSKDLQTYSSLSRKYSLLLRGPVCVIKKKRYILCMCVCVCVCCRCGWLCALTYSVWSCVPYKTTAEEVEAASGLSLGPGLGGLRGPIGIKHSLARPHIPQHLQHTKALCEKNSPSKVRNAHVRQGNGACWVTVCRR